MPETHLEITQLLDEASGSPDSDAASELYEHVYGDLRRIARGQLRRLRPGQTLDTTALVHESFLRLIGANEFNNRGHFFATAARAMRQILIDYARGRGSMKRGGDQVAVDLDKAQLAIDEQADLVLSVDQALERLAQLNERWVRVVECRFFAGLNEGETAEALGVSISTAQRDWTKARLWLRRELTHEDPDT